MLALQSMVTIYSFEFSRDDKKNGFHGTCSPSKTMEYFQYVFVLLEQLTFV